MRLILLSKWGLIHPALSGIMAHPQSLFLSTTSVALLFWIKKKSPHPKSFSAKSTGPYGSSSQKKSRLIEEMMDYAHRFSEGMPKGKLVRLVEHYGNCLSQLELEGELAHEFGHIQAHHLNPTRGRFLQWLLGMLIQVTIPMCIGGVVALLSGFFSDSQHAVIPLSYGLCAGLVTRTAMSPQLLRKSIRYVRRVWEKEADAIAASAPDVLRVTFSSIKKISLSTSLKRVESITSANRYSRIKHILLMLHGCSFFLANGFKNKTLKI